MEPSNFINTLAQAGFSPFMGVPCSIFKHCLNYLDDHPEIKKYTCCSEGEAIALAAGFALSGRNPVVYMQNDGYGNAVNPLSSLQLMYKLPTLLLISWRAAPGTEDAPQHRIMGETILSLLKTFNIPYRILENDVSELGDSINEAKEHFSKHSTPFAFIIKKAYFKEYKTGNNISFSDSELNERRDYIKILADYINKQDVILGATGFTGRELFQDVEHTGKFYMMGSMGCLAAIGLAIAQEKQDRKVYLLDGDGALLMRMGSLSTVGFYHPSNLIHICFDNQQYESTGGQPTTSSTVDFSQVARACGYNSFSDVRTVEEFRDSLAKIKEQEEPIFIRIKIKPGTSEGLSRPEDSPEKIKDNFMNFLNR